MQKIFSLPLFIIALGMAAQGCAKTDMQANNPYNIYKFQLKNSFIALSPLPGRVDMAADMQMIQENQIENVVTLISTEEMTKYGVPTLLNHYTELNMEVLHSPITDYGLPSVEQMKTILTWVHKKIKAKEDVLIHCVGGLGRSGTVMAVYAVNYLGKTGEDAIKFVRSVRGEGAVETEEQEKFVKEWK